MKRSIADKLSRVNEGHLATSSSRRRSSSSGCSVTSGSNVHRCLNNAVLPLTVPLGLPANLTTIDVVNENSLRTTHRRGRYVTANVVQTTSSSSHRLQRRRHALKPVIPSQRPSLPVFQEEEQDEVDATMNISTERGVHQPRDKLQCSNCIHQFHDAIATYDCATGVVIRMICVRCQQLAINSSCEMANNGNSNQSRRAKHCHITDNIEQFNTGQVLSVNPCPTRLNALKPLTVDRLTPSPEVHRKSDLQARHYSNPPVEPGKQLGPSLTSVCQGCNDERNTAKAIRVGALSDVEPDCDTAGISSQAPVHVTSL